MNKLVNRIKIMSESFFEEIKTYRRHLHQHPELSFEEYHTADFIENKLMEIGIENIKRIAKTGVTFLLEGSSKGRNIALRADIDALPILEKNRIDYKSKFDGIMHACGHDVHTSCLLGVAKILHQLKSEFKGSVKFIFQPGEEKIPGGASVLIKEGILENPIPKTILGQHVMPLIEVGKVGFRLGKYMASSDEIYLTIEGKGGHAAMPEKLVDPVIITSHILIALQQIISRKASPKTPSVLSFGNISGKGAGNVIPDFVDVAGTFRTFDETWRTEALALITQMAEGIAASMGAKCKVRIENGYPYVFNDPEYTERNISAAQEYLGIENVVNLDLWMASEDFSFYSQNVDGCFYRLGTRNEAKSIVSGVHTHDFNIDEDAIKIGMGLMSWLTIQELNH
ncbi:MAG: N-acyl-L-amino acid amidohydrolase [Flammeovirgaceae bacterium]|nr:N-acyl-L-amino acid amidohydrolase [Flammeovirgaceae bacterium]|tara:strand:- start:898 stop:2088 length:1191 start_codon:yes stop_codon:yes gene_type:complete